MVFVSWTPQWRASRFAEALGNEVVIPAAFAVAWPWPLRYALQAVATAWYLIRRRPRSVLVTNPPFLACTVAVVCGKLSGTKVWADNHSGPWNDPRWSRFARANAWTLARCDGELFHNPELMSQHATGEARLSWVPPLKDLATGRASVERGPVVAIMSYKSDEPLSEILAAASQTPEIEWVFTGRPPDDLKARLPANVTLAGFVPRSEFDALVASASAVVCLTKWPATMQQGIADALEFGVTGITTDNSTLRAWVDGTSTALLVDWSDASAIAAAVRRCVSPEWVYDTVGRARLLQRSWDAFAELRALLEGPVSDVARPDA